MEPRPFHHVRIDEMERRVASPSASMSTLMGMVEELVRFRRLRKRHRAVLSTAIQRMMTMGAPFAWPSTYARESESAVGLQGVFRYEVGMLKILGYTTGVRAPSRSERWRTLDMAFLAPLPYAHDAEYTRSWGRPGSAERLHRIADSIAATTRNLKRSDAQLYDAAITQREEDLAYLRKRYYEPLYRSAFSWPRVL